MGKRIFNRHSPGVQVYLVDEIGKMECLSDRFIANMRALVTGRPPVIATVGLPGKTKIVSPVTACRCEGA